MSWHTDEQSGYTYFRFEDLLHSPDILRFNIELQCVIVLTLVRECVGINDFYFDMLRLSFDRPENDKTYEKHFKCPIKYSCSHNEFVLKSSRLLTPTARSNPIAMPLLLNQCDTVLNSMTYKNSLLISVNQWVSENIHKDVCAEQLANHLYMTPRTLRRKLSEHGTSFERL